MSRASRFFNMQAMESSAWRKIFGPGICQRKPLSSTTPHAISLIPITEKRPLASTGVTALHGHGVRKAMPKALEAYKTPADGASVKKTGMVTHNNKGGLKTNVKGQVLHLNRDLQTDLTLILMRENRYIDPSICLKCEINFS